MTMRSIFRIKMTLLFSSNPLYQLQKKTYTEREITENIVILTLESQINDAALRPEWLQCPICVPKMGNKFDIFITFHLIADENGLGITLVVVISLVRYQCAHINDCERSENL